MLKISRGIRDMAGYKTVAIILSRYFLYLWNPNARAYYFYYATHGRQC
jgi:hypothetical protein